MRRRRARRVWTALSGLMDVRGVDACIRLEVIGRAPRGDCGSVVRAGRTVQIVNSLILLNPVSSTGQALAGGESVSDLDVLEKDAGLCRVLREVETYGMRRRERRALKARWRIERRRSVPSDSAVLRYLERFPWTRDEEAWAGSSQSIHTCSQRSSGWAGEGQRRLGGLRAEAVRLIGRPRWTWDATLVETHKQEALYSYKKYRAYQPLTTYWAEADLIVHSEFRDGNVPAGYQQLRVLTEALEHLPSGVDKVMLRSDTAGYQRELLRYCAEGRGRALRSDRICGRS